MVASDALAAPFSAAAVWTPEATPVVPGVSSKLESVACPTDQTCFAVGSTLEAGGHPTAIAMTRTSAGWSTLPLVQPRAAWSDLASIACAGPRLCIAVGTAVPHRGRARGLAERWNGSSWAIMPISGRELASVACGSSRFCVAVGGPGAISSAGPGVIERWNGRRWATDRTLPSVSLSAVSCSSPRACLAVGSEVSSAAPATVERWMGHGWSELHPAPTRNAGSAAAFGGVWCWSARACLSVGSYDISRATMPVAELWRPGRWTASYPFPDVAESAALNSIACHSRTDCMAVGGDDNGGLVDRFDGRRWHRSHSAGNASASLSAVACRPAFCVAVGSESPDPLGETSPSTFAESWPGRQGSRRVQGGPTSRTQ